MPPPPPPTPPTPLPAAPPPSAPAPPPTTVTEERLGAAPLEGWRYAMPPQSQEPDSVPCRARTRVFFISDVRERHGTGAAEWTHKQLGFEARLLLHRCDISPVRSLQACVAPGRDGRAAQASECQSKLTRVDRSSITFLCPAHVFVPSTVREQRISRSHMWAHAAAPFRAFGMLRGALARK
jgi:hypothetical protein